MLDPNITGSFYSRINNDGKYSGMIVWSDGVFETTKFFNNTGGIGYIQQNSNFNGRDRTYFAASRFSAIYNSVNTVQPSSTRLLCLVRT